MSRENHKFFQNLKSAYFTGFSALHLWAQLWAGYNEGKTIRGSFDTKSSQMSQNKKERLSSDSLKYGGAGRVWTYTTLGIASACSQKIRTTPCVPLSTKNLFPKTNSSLKLRTVVIVWIKPKKSDTCSRGTPVKNIVQNTITNINLCFKF